MSERVTAADTRRPACATTRTSTPNPSAAMETVVSTLARNDAVRSAIELQRSLSEQNTGLTAEQRIDLRVGINVGDIIADRDDIYGAGVNIAARLEQISEPGGVCVSGRVHEDIEGKLDWAFLDLGERTLKNIERPVRVYSVPSSAIGPSTAPLAETPKQPADQPSIAVLPFTCFSELREFKFLTEAMTEDLITMLARIPGFIVIARQSSFAYQGRLIDSRQIGRELGVRYIVEGSLRPVGQQLRVGAQLIDAATGAQLWANRFDGQVENVLELQDQIARAIAGRIEPELVRAEIALIKRRRDANPNAWSCFRQGAGVISLKGWSEETLTQATALLRQATTLDPDFALARAQLALFLSLGARLGLVADGVAAVKEARAEAERAVTIDQDASEVLGYAGCALAELGDVQRGSEILERAIENDPSNAQAWVALGTSLCFLENTGDVGLEKLRHGMRLSPRDHRLGFWGTFYALALTRHRRLTGLTMKSEQPAVAIRSSMSHVSSWRSRRPALAARKRQSRRCARHGVCAHASRLRRFRFWSGVARHFWLLSGARCRNPHSNHLRNSPRLPSCTVAPCPQADLLVLDYVAEAA